MEFFRANDYDVALPDHSAFVPEANPPGSLETFTREVYDVAEFARAMETLSGDREILSQALDWFAAAAKLDGFRAYDQVEVTLTLYGPGGSFDPETGTIVLFTTPDGHFKGGGGAHTIVHEMMHLAVEDGLVQRFGLSHWEKERLVDLLVQREFVGSLPDYSLQSGGEENLDRFLEGVPLEQVSRALERYRSHPNR